jgi:Asp-tRNA(Asn)/Glu-tRNA(Gln) amidotransferase A subunit family amidase
MSEEPTDIETMVDKAEWHADSLLYLQGARIGVLREVIDTQTADAEVMQLFQNALSNMTSQGLRLS